MTPEQFEKLEAIVLAVEGLPPADRDTYVDRHCQGDPELRAQVEALLAVRHSTVGFLETPVLAGGVDFGTERTTSGVGPSDVGDILIGTQFGQYSIKRILGRGGMGVVYEAEQDHPRRLVALKVVHPQLISDAVRARFKSEVQILAHLNHECVARFIDAGVHAGLPYFAMERVPGGRTIVEYARAENLDVRTRLELFSRVCDAVAHGHLKGVIHRDLKPNNILVDDAGTPKVIDFGVARATGGDMTVTTQHTDVGQLIGTLQYMSPEQVRGESGNTDTRSDVYSLGVVLYELLCGRPPYRVASSSIGRAARIVEYQHPDRPSTINRLLRGDVETIVLKAIEKDPANRYQSAADFRDDIKRYLHNLPIKARRTGPLKLFVLFARRHKTGTAVAGGALLAFSATIIVILSLYFQVASGRIARRAANELIVRVDQQFLPRFGGVAPFFLVEELDKSERRPGRGSLVVFNPDAQAIEFQNDAGDVLQIIEALPPEAAPAWSRWIQATTNAADPLTPQLAMLEDFDPACPGRELAVVFGGGNTKIGLLRVYDLDLNVKHELWNHGGIGFLVWNSQHSLLLYSGVAAFLDCFEPRLTGIATAGCPIGQEHLEVVFAVRPENMDGTTSLLSFAELPAARTEWVLTHHRDDGEHPQRNWAASISSLARPAPELLDAAVIILLQCENLGTIINRQYHSFTFRVPVSIAGVPLEPFEPPRQLHANRAPSTDDFVRVNLNALFRVKEAVIRAFEGTASLDEAVQTLASFADIPEDDRHVANRALEAMYTNWRWLNSEAAKCTSATGDTGDPARASRALAWARTAVAMHDDRCPATEHCIARVYPLNTLGLALYRSGNSSGAIHALRESNELADRLRSKYWMAEQTYRECRGWNEVYLALAAASLGEMSAARNHLQEAEEDRPYVYHAQEFATVLNEAREVTGSSQP